MFLKKSEYVFFITIFVFILNMSNFAYAADSALGLNYEAVKFRAATEKQIDAMNTLREVLQFCDIVFPIQTQAEVKKKGLDISIEKIYKQMLASKSSGEIFGWYRKFLSENKTLSDILQKTFIETKSVDERKPVFRIGTTEFSVRWFWLYPAKSGLMLVAQDETTRTAADEIWGAGVFRYVFEIRFPLPAKLRQSPFWEKGMAKIFESFPSARFLEDSLELVYLVFPNSSGIPGIVQRSLELMTN
jgi:hypothetical protein